MEQQDEAAREVNDARKSEDAWPIWESMNSPVRHEVSDEGSLIR